MEKSEQSEVQSRRKSNAQVRVASVLAFVMAVQAMQFPLPAAQKPATHGVQVRSSNKVAALTWTRVTGVSAPFVPEQPVIGAQAIASAAAKVSVAQSPQTTSAVAVASV